MHAIATSRTALFLGLALAASATAHAGVRLQSASLEADGRSATLTLHLSGATRGHVYRLDAPARVVIDLPGTSRAAALRLPPARGVVTAVRGAVRPGGDYRLVLALGSASTGEPRVTASQAGRAYRLEIGIGAGVAPAPAAAARVVQAAHSPEHDGRDIVIAVDAGHGGEDPGATGQGGTHEKDVVLAIARALAARLNEQPGMRAVLTRDSDRLIDLRERMERAHAAHADLFVSIHADAVRDRTIAGASVYTLSYRGASSEAARMLADRENAAVLRGGVSLAGVNPNLASVLLDVAQSANMGVSVEVADEVLGALDHVGAVRKNVVQHAAFVVLKSPDLPSMLVETAYISNPSEERKLRSSAYQAQLAAAIEGGVIAYFRTHPPDGTLYAQRRRNAEGSPDAVATLARGGG